MLASVYITFIVLSCVTFANGTEEMEMEWFFKRNTSRVGRNQVSGGSKINVEVASLSGHIIITCFVQESEIAWEIHKNRLFIVSSTSTNKLFGANRVNHTRIIRFSGLDTLQDSQIVSVVQNKFNHVEIHLSIANGQSPHPIELL